MEKNVRLVNIYIKIHNKHALTMDDMTFLAKWDPECFAKTCHNLVYNLPQTGKLMRPAEEENGAGAKRREEGAGERGGPAAASRGTVEYPPARSAASEREQVENFLANLKRLEKDDLMVQDVSAERVKSLMGNLYMEMMFPHNDKEAYFDMPSDPRESVFNKRA